jgi:hypothetical protein
VTDFFFSRDSAKSHTAEKKFQFVALSAWRNGHRNSFRTKDRGFESCWNVACNLKFIVIEDEKLEK